MKIDLVDVDQFIVENGCLEVTDPVYFDAAAPRENGLFSTSLFGEVGSKTRSTQFGYIDLHAKFFNPVIYRLLTTIERRTKDIVAGTVFVTLDDKGYIVEDDTKGETGIDFFYKNWSKIVFKTSPSDTRKTKLNIIKKANIDQIFIDKWLVMPAGLRDYNLNGSGGGVADVDVINDMYATIIRSTRNLDASSFSFVTANTKYQVQETLLQIYEKLVVGDLSDKKGLLRRGLMGKSVDYATRSIITAPYMYSETYDTLQVPFGYTGIPLSQLVVLFYPFFLKYILDFVELHKDDFSHVIDMDGNVILIDDVEEQFTDEKVKKILDNFIRDIDGRFKRIKVKSRKTGEYYPVPIFHEDLGRDFTVTDLLYIAAVDICADKHVYVTRYPVGNFLNIYPSKIKILSTSKTVDVKLEDRLLKNYPLVFPDYPSEEFTWIDSVRVNNSYTSALGADFDGKSK